ncbi:SID1 transmembrane family member 1-like isoform X2 [Nymphalis io]|uniref:SID1 transmembrane family member 1-like isoform X2 n=1 Tax=Inachis io TaxID=171585 RepID=UPI00216A342C|nr:SID1 transmembrane family member 1-like isoform X2 [Nymphalis io]
MKVMYGVCVVLLLVGCACASQSTVTVLQLQLTYNEIHTLSINNTIEYILEFTPPQPLPLAAPSLVWVQSVGADTAHPVLVTARQRAGAVTWQIPYESDAHTLYELERTLCPDDTADGGSDSCEGQTRTAFSLHISSACAAPTSLRVRVSQPFVWDLPFARAVTVSATQSMPRVTHYRFIEGQTSVRLIVSSENEVCATLSVQNYSCPIAQTVTDVSTSGLRLTMMRSGAVQLSRSEYPLGFYVVALVLPSEQACGGAAAGERDWLWAAALLGADAARARSLARHKAFTISVEAALTREQYAVAAVVTLFLFLAFYVIFGALVLAQRWPPFAKYVLPKAVLASQTDAIDASAAEQALDGQSEIRSEGTTPARLRRRGSDVTFDSSDNSDSDDSSAPAALPASSTPVGTPAGANQNSSNENRTSTSPASASQVPANESAVTPPAATGRTDVDGAQSAATPNGRTDGTEIQGPFGLPARLRLAALARRGGRTLRARSDRYLYTLYTVAVFYALPVVQFVIAFQIILNVSGSLDICYYNFLCAHRAGALSDFNHVLSNLGYLLLGALFLLQVRRRRLRRKRQPRHQDYGIPAHYGLLSALGAGMMVVAVLSASYHVCPNRLNFQFDTAFMYVLAVLIMVKIYQSRHPDVNARAHATFGVLAVLIALVVWGVLDGGPLFWGVFTVFHVFTFLLLSLRIYYVGQFRLEKESLAQAASELRKGSRPLYRARLVLLLVANALNWMLAIFGAATSPATCCRCYWATRSCTWCSTWP